MITMKVIAVSAFAIAARWRCNIGAGCVGASRARGQTVRLPRGSVRRLSRA